MKNEEKDVPMSSDFAKSQEAKGPQLPDFLTSKTGAIAGLAIVAVVAGVIYLFGHIDFSRTVTNPLESRPGFAALRSHVEALAEVDATCAQSSEKLSCLCELADRIRDERNAIDSLVSADPSLRGFAIAVRRPASVTYDIGRLPKAPEESECLNAVSAPTIIDDSSVETSKVPAPQPAAIEAPSSPAQ